jgi:integrase
MAVGPVSPAYLCESLGSELNPACRAASTVGGVFLTHSLSSNFIIKTDFARETGTWSGWASRPKFSPTTGRPSARGPRRRYPIRDRVIILLSVRAGLRAKEISNIRWSMVTDAEGAVTDTIHLVNGASKGKRGGREIPMAKDLRQALVEFQAFKPATFEDRIIFSERDMGISPKALAIWFLTLYRDLGFKGASSHSGRRTFITKAAKRVTFGISSRAVHRGRGAACVTFSS